MFQVPKLLRVLGKTLGARSPDDGILSIPVHLDASRICSIRQADAKVTMSDYVGKEVLPRRMSRVDRPGQPGPEGCHKATSQTALGPVPL